MKETTEHILKLGETADIQGGIFQANIKVIYACMVSDSSYSIVVRWPLGNNSLAYNLYFTDRATRLTLDNLDSQEVVVPWFSPVLFGLPISDFRLASSFRGMATDRQREIHLPKGKMTVINVGRDQLIFKHEN